MKHRIRFAAQSIAFCLSLLLLFSCGQNVTTEDTTDIAVTTTAPITEVQTTETEPMTESVTEPITETETETEAVTEAPEPAYPTVIDENGTDALTGIAPAADGTYIDPLTGTAVAKEEAERRPVAIMLNNINVALPQQNIGSADILYECQVEGYLTRLMGVYNDYEDLKAIGSVRSSREYYIDFAANHDAIYVHAGGSEEAYRNLKSRKTHNIDAVNDYNVSGYFYRDPNRLGRMGYEHTLVIDGDKINGAIAAKKYRTTYSSSFTNPLQFIGEGQQINLVNGTKAKQLTVKFGAHTTQFVYSASKNLYMRWQNNEKHIDGITGEQLGFENVVVLFCPYTLTKDDYNHIEVATTGKGKGYYLTGGKKVDIHWSKSSGDAQVKLYYASGKALTLTPGKTNIEIVGYESATSIIEE
ncbi:MAG: DUF3048 domain-containing protein [Clostridia bacterium]|nr:DUF3048 domain-containing protein [Clostridia bacterium]